MRSDWNSSRDTRRRRLNQLDDPFGSLVRKSRRYQLIFYSMMIHLVIEIRDIAVKDCMRFLSIDPGTFPELIPSSLAIIKTVFNCGEKAIAKYLIPRPSPNLYAVSKLIDEC
jgi:hypothetical protein